jgi:hypothetical protein
MRVSRAVIAVHVAACLAAAGEAAGQVPAPGASRTGRRPLLPRAEEIALARSAAPPAVSDSATVHVLADSGYVVAERGTNGVECYVSRSWPDALEPHCFDAEGAATIMRIEMHQVELLHGGMSVVDADRQIGADLAAGRFRLPRRPALSWMMSGGQVLINDEGRRAGRWQPHLMIYYPFLGAAELGLTTPNPTVAMLAGGGAATSSIIVVVREFVQPRTARADP